jgi:DNA adenine methylase
MTVKRPVLRYHGGKWRLAPWLIKQMPEHLTYVEPFGGAASVLMRKERSKGEVYNDLDGNIVNLFRILREPESAAELERLLRLTPFSREEFRASYEPPVSDIDAAWKAIVRSFMGFSTDAVTRGVKCGFRSRRTKGILPSLEWSTFADALPSFTQRLQGVVIECRNAFQIIAHYDSEDTFFLVDPPYVESTRGSGMGSGKHGYQHELSDNDHRMLGLLLRGIKGKVMICGYWSRLYEELYRDWRYADAKCYANGAHERHERIWMNYPA